MNWNNIDSDELWDIYKVSRDLVAELGKNKLSRWELYTKPLQFLCMAHATLLAELLHEMVRKSYLWLKEVSNW